MRSLHRQKPEIALIETDAHDMPGQWPNVAESLSN